MVSVIRNGLLALMGLFLLGITSTVFSENKIVSKIGFVNSANAHTATNRSRSRHMSSHRVRSHGIKRGVARHGIGHYRYNHRYYNRYNSYRFHPYFIRNTYRRPYNCYYLYNFNYNRFVYVCNRYHRYR